MAKKQQPKRLGDREPEDLQEHIDKALALRGQTDASRNYKLFQFLFDPQVLHLDRIDMKRPSIFVSNHAMWGWEGGLLPSVVCEHTGMLPRLLTDSTVMLSPFQDSLMKLGMVLANRKVCAAMMDAGESIWVFPGGGREGAKRRGEQYKLFWENRTGFVRMAMQHGFTITPVAVIGPDEMWDVRWDRDDMKGTWVESILRRVAGDSFSPEEIPPIPKGLLGTLLPRPERFYIAFGEPFDTLPYADCEQDGAELDEIKDTVQTRVEELIKEVLLLRTQSRHNMHWLRRRLTRY